jgi:uncharacterized protein YlzI (FlbEa/FlbD family)
MATLIDLKGQMVEMKMALKELTAALKKASKETKKASKEVSKEAPKKVSEEAKNEAMAAKKKPEDLAFSSEDIELIEFGPRIRTIELIDGKIYITDEDGVEVKIQYRRWKGLIDGSFCNKATNTIHMYAHFKFRFHRATDYNLFMNYVDDWRMMKGDD